MAVDKRTASYRVVMNREAVAAVRLGTADALFSLCKDILYDTHPPDAPPYGEGLPLNGGAIVWVDGRKVAGVGLYSTPRKPRAARLLRPGITAVVGFGFPARFNERGTLRQPARPFFAPVVAQHLPDARDRIRSSIRRFVNLVRS